MRTIFWIIILLCCYIWVVSAGHERIVIEKTRKVVETVNSWFDDADVDYQTNTKPIITKKRPRRWE